MIRRRFRNLSNFINRQFHKKSEMMVMIVYNYPEIINTQEETVPIVKTDKIDIAPVSALVE